MTACRTAYFTDQLYAALTLIDRGILSAGTRGSMHGEIGHTQFPAQEHPGLRRRKSRYRGGALSSTANFLKGHGWRAGRRIPARRRPILQLSRPGMPLLSISGPSRSSAGRSTEGRASLRDAEGRAPPGKAPINFAFPAICAISA